MREDGASCPDACVLCESGATRILFQAEECRTPRPGYGWLTSDPLARKKVPPVVRCRVCGFSFRVGWSESDVHAVYREMKNTAYGRWEEDARCTARRMLNLLHRATGGRQGTLLDVGCGAGYFADEARRVGWEVQGLEPSRYAVEIAVSELGLQVQRGEIEDFKPPGKRYDAVTAFEVLEHLVNPVGAVGRIYDLLKPRGVFLATTPNAGSVFARILGRRWWYLEEGHLYYFTRAHLAKLLETCGLDVFVLRGYLKKSASVAYLIHKLCAEAKWVNGLAKIAERSSWLSGLRVRPYFDEIVALGKKRSGGRPSMSDLGV